MSEDASCTRAGTVRLFNAMVENVAHEVEVLLHAVIIPPRRFEPVECAVRPVAFSLMR